MSKPLLEIEPKELKFLFELKKQSSCSVQLTNNTYQYVAFKVKTTSPKKYSVRPNVGVLMPKSSCAFIVTMQAQKVAPTDLVCKDKFLIQGTTVPIGTTDEDVTSSMFVKDDSRYVEENKLKVVLTSPPHSPELFPINGAFSPEHMVAKGAEHKTADQEIKHEEEMELKAEDVACQVVEEAEQDMANDELHHEIEMELKPEQAIACQVVKDAEQEMANEELQREKEMELKPEQAIACQVVKDAGQELANKELQHEKEMELKPEQAVACQVVKNAEEKMVNEELQHELLELKSEQAIACQVGKDAECKMVNEELKHGREMELKPEHDLVFNPAKDLEELKREKDVGLNTVNDIEELKPTKKARLDVSKRVEELKLIEVIEETNLKLSELESRLNEVVVTISKLTEERRLSNQEIIILQEKLVDLSKMGMRKVQVGFPLLYVCMVALLFVFLGYRLHC